jgi:uncharacterized protein YvpB
MTMEKKQPAKSSTSGVARAWRVFLGMLLGMVAFIALAAAGVFGLFAIRPATAVQPVAHAEILDAGLLEITPDSSVTPAIRAATPTPFRPVTNTTIPTHTSTPTPTSTATLTPTATATLTLTSTITPLPTDTPEPPSEPAVEALPNEAHISGLTGYNQSLPLSCESRSAVDWARFFGLDLSEIEFQDALPTSDNPNTGFVGDPRHEQGKIPPNSYGVHSAPVAALLQAYGLNAWSHSGMGMDDIRREIAAGRPVIVWVVGNVWHGRGVAYTASDGETLTVVPREHTVIVTGYNQVAVTVVDGGMTYSSTVERFLDSWSVLGQQGIVLEQSR